MEIYLVRHTIPEVEKGICYGHTDLDVAATFQSEYPKVHRQISYDGNTKIYSSPLLRCKKLAATFGNAVEHDPRLMELDFGSWEMKAWDTIDPNELNPWMNDFVTTRVPQGESYQQLLQRMVAFFKEAVHSAHDKTIIVTHAGPIRALLAHINKMALKDSFSIQLSYGHVLLLENKGTTFTISKGLIHN